jgi:sodium-dependent phosphate cotransporter
MSDLIIRLDSKTLDAYAVDPDDAKRRNLTLIKHVCKSDKGESYQCKFLFNNYWDEWVDGLVILVISLVLLIGCLICLVKILSSIFKGPAGAVLTKFVNSDLPGFLKYFSGTLAIIIGCVFTIIVQSSSVFTSTLVPLVGMGLVTIERVFPLTLGSNIGTTITGILSSLTTPDFKISLQIALCHTLFNISGIIIWYPIPFMRAVPLKIAKLLGSSASEYKWVAIVYLLLAFFIVPAILLGLSFAGLIALLCILIPVLVLIATIVLINIFQNKCPSFLPQFLKSWDFLPVPLRSLKPYDDIINKNLCCCICCHKLKSKPIDEIGILTSFSSESYFENDIDRKL